MSYDMVLVGRLSSQLMKTSRLPLTVTNLWTKLTRTSLQQNAHCRGISVCGAQRHQLHELVPRCIAVRAVDRYWS